MIKTVLYGVVAVIVLGVGVAVHGLTEVILNWLHHQSSENADEINDILPHPFGLNDRKAERLQKILFYVGLISGVVLFLIGRRTSVFLVFTFFFISGIVLKRVIEAKRKQWKKEMVRELPTFLDTFLSLYQSGAKMETAIEDSLVVTKRLPYAFYPVLSKWHERGGPDEALKYLQVLDIAELNTCATMFRQVVKGGERSEQFLSEWKNQLAEMEHLNQEAGSSTKPIAYTALLGLPFAASIVTWFYPFIIKTEHMFDGFLGMGS